MKVNIFILTGLIFLVSCESNVENFQITPTDPKLVLLSYAYADSSAKLYVSRNISLDEPVKLYPVTNANCELFENNVSVGNFIIGNDDWYSAAGITFKEGSEYKYEVSADGYNTVTGNFYVPIKPEIISVDTQFVSEPQPNCPDCKPLNYFRFDIEFLNNSDTEDYYMIEFDCRHYEYVRDYFTEEIVDSIFVRNLQMFSNAPYIESVVRNSTFSSSEYYYNPTQGEEASGHSFIFSDKYLNNGKNTLTLKISAAFTEDAKEKDFNAELVIKSIDFNMYEYALSKGRSSLAEDNIFVEPVTIYSNIEYGLGLVSGFSVFKQKFNLSRQGSGVNEKESLIQ